MMSRPSHLPPRCPLQNKCLRTRSLDSSDKVFLGDDQLLPELFRYPSMDSLLEEHPSWLDELLADSDTSSLHGHCHRRSASDSLTISHAPMPPPAFHNAVIHEAQEGAGNVHGSGVEESCVYGPNSPRERSKLTSSESAIVNALLETVPRNKLAFAEISGGSRIYEQDEEGNFAAEHEAEKSSRRRSGQRSRVRKLQYISDLQKTVEALQTMGAELAANIACVFQQRVSLSLENKSLRKQISVLLHEKIIKDGEHQHLQREAERLKMISRRHRRSKSISSLLLDSGPHVNSDYSPLDFRKLSLGDDGPVALNHTLEHTNMNSF
ncbi:hypothetical protein KSP39_PZI014606 [Platanthera zijinensis]|uniref:Uncharacterized protein n=1 Tax=Platanthera zijinensis TaxID=2320716 RepID=A0AAP0G2Q4_9ASPA